MSPATAKLHCNCSLRDTICSTFLSHISGPLGQWSISALQAHSACCKPQLWVFTALSNHNLEPGTRRAAKLSGYTTNNTMRALLITITLMALNGSDFTPFAQAPEPNLASHCGLRGLRGYYSHCVIVQRITLGTMRILSCAQSETLHTNNPYRSLTWPVEPDHKKAVVVRL